jgi:hypothetical protein
MSSNEQLKKLLKEKAEAVALANGSAWMLSIGLVTLAIKGYVPGLGLLILLNVMFTLVLIRDIVFVANLPK